MSDFGGSSSKKNQFFRFACLDIEIVTGSLLLFRPQASHIKRVADDGPLIFFENDRLHLSRRAIRGPTLIPVKFFPPLCHSLPKELGRGPVVIQARGLCLWRCPSLFAGLTRRRNERPGLR